MTQTDSIQHQKVGIARKILLLSRNELLINYGYLNSALGSFRYQQTDQIKTVGTDGIDIYFNPDFIINQYQKQPFWLNRAHIHIILHCLYKHPFVVGTENDPDWNLACEIAVDYVLDDFVSKYIPQPRKVQKETAYTPFEVASKLMTAQNIYKTLKGMDALQKERLNELFLYDDHSFWYQPPSQTKSKSKSQYQIDSNGDSESDDGSSSNKEESKQDDQNTGSSSHNDLDTDQSLSGASKEQAMEYWKQIGQSINMDLQTFHKNRGDQSGNLLESIELVNRDKYNYTSFLEKFAVLKEEMRMDLDSFDYIFYTYGLTLYKNLPLIEPLEYRESNKIYEFVIAIDTSGSVSNQLVKQFLNKTYHILKSKESFHKKVNIHIIQCDTVIHEDKRITNDEEFEAYARNFVAKGRGGTDFRPVFEHVDHLIETKQLYKLKGLLYFTDGWGVFPNKRTIYDTAFVFIKDDAYNENVPSWAIKLVLDPDDLTT